LPPPLLQFMTAVCSAEGAYTSATGAAAELATSARNQDRAGQRERLLEKLTRDVGGGDWSMEGRLFQV
jgi:hypothetical protein